MKRSKWLGAPIGLAILLLSGTALVLGQSQSTSTSPPPPPPPRPATISSEGAASQSTSTSPPAPAAPKPATVSSEGATETPSPERVAVLDLEAIDASKGQAATATDRLREELLRIGKFTLVNRDQMEQLFKEQAFQQAVCTGVDCAAKAGKVLGVHKIITGRITKLDDTHWVLTVSLLDVETAQVVRAETLRYEGAFFAFLGSGIEQISARLTGAEPGSGQKPENAALPPSVRMPQMQVPPDPGAKK